MKLEVDIEKRLGSFHLRAKFQTDKGILALLGASGCGKSMTLKCIAGIEKPDRGRIVLGDTVLFDSAQHINLPPQKRHVGYLFQQYALFPNMTAEQNIRCAIRGGTREEKKKTLAELIRRFRLDGLEKKLPSQLSGGQQQRVALARILAAKPNAILLDEPFSALDSFLKWNLELELSSLLADFDGPIVWVSHDLGECRRNCARVCVMEDGLAGALQSMESLIFRPNCISAARLAGYKNFYDATACHDGVYVPEWNLTICGVLAPDSAFTLCIPPEAICLSDSGSAWRVCRVIPDVRSTIALLLPLQAQENAACLRAELPPDTRLQEGALVHITLQPEAVLTLPVPATALV